MRELARPWMHWFSVASSSTLRDDLEPHTAKSRYAGSILVGDPFGLETVIRTPRTITAYGCSRCCFAAR